MFEGVDDVIILLPVLNILCFRRSECIVSYQSVINVYPLKVLYNQINRWVLNQSFVYGRLERSFSKTLQFELYRTGISAMSKSNIIVWLEHSDHEPAFVLVSFWTDSVFRLTIWWWIDSCCWNTVVADIIVI